MDQVFIYSDGSAKGNPGPAGFGTLLQFRDSAGALHEKEMSGGFRLSTNNRMELLGAIMGLEALKRPCHVVLTTDSEYLKNGFTEGWVAKWQANGWKTASKKPVKNRDLWQRLVAAKEPHQVEFRWVKGHAGHPENERCDDLAQTAADGTNLPADEGYETQ